jgi:acyl carrier protein
MNETQRTIAELLAKQSETAIDVESIDFNQPVFGPAGVISDSLKILDALASIEKEFAIHVPDEDLTEELFSSVRVLSEYVERQKVTAR